MAKLDVLAVFADAEAVAQRAQEWLKELEGALSPLRVLDPRVLGEDRPEFAVQNGKLLLVGQYPTHNTLEELVTAEAGTVSQMIWQRCGDEPLVELPAGGYTPIVVTLVGVSEQYGIWPTRNPGGKFMTRSKLLMTGSDELLGIAVHAVCKHLSTRYYWPKEADLAL